jgi:integrase
LCCRHVAQHTPLLLTSDAPGHQGDGSSVEVRFGVVWETFVVAHVATGADQPAQCALDHPPAGQDLEAGLPRWALTVTVTNGHRLSALFELALRTGLRMGELLGLRWEDPDLAGETASIRRTLQRTNSAGLTALPAKTHSSERRIALPTECLHPLTQHRDRQAQEREAAGTGWNASGYVFTPPDGNPIEGATLTRHFNALLRRATLRRIRFHDLGHSAATLLLEQGVELVVIKELLGHAHIGVTATVYAHVRLRLQRDAIDLLGNALRNPAEPAARPDDGDEPPVCAAPVR